MIPKEISYEVIENVYKKLSNYIIKTPLINNGLYSIDLFNTHLFLKLEFLQNAGCFKTRGVINNLLNLSEEQKIKGITAVSAGNHAIAASYGANKFALKNKIFMYETANNFRKKTVKNLGANLYLTNPQDAFKDVENASKNEGYYFVHPFDGKFTIQGTASLGYEICQQIENIDNIIISVGGGGLIAGVGSIIRQKFPKCNIIGVEPEGAKGITESLKKDKPIKKVNINSIADSLCSPLHMDYSFSICKSVIDRMINVSDNDLIKAMKFMYENFKLILEPACVAGIAALLGPLKNKLVNQNTVIILCGSNMDLKTWNNIIAKI